MQSAPPVRLTGSWTFEAVSQHRLITIVFSCSVLGSVPYPVGVGSANSSCLRSPARNRYEHRGKNEGEGGVVGKSMRECPAREATFPGRQALAILKRVRRDAGRLPVGLDAYCSLCVDHGPIGIRSPAFAKLRSSHRVCDQAHALRRPFHDLMISGCGGGPRVSPRHCQR